MATQEVVVFGELTASARDAIEEAGLALGQPTEGGESRGDRFLVRVEAGNAAEARHRVEDVLKGIDGFSAGAAQRVT